MPEVTAVVAAICALFYVAMSADVAYLRRHHRVALQGLGDNKHVTRAVRAHGNFSEYVPLALLLMLIMEQMGIPKWAVGLAGGTLLLGRLLHWIGIKGSSGPSTGRLAGMALTWTALTGEALGLLGWVFANQ
ncbi:MAG: MAPEG family protein [Myxococcota bacterium]